MFAPLCFPGSHSHSLPARFMPHEPNSCSLSKNFSTTLRLHSQQNAGHRDLLLHSHGSPCYLSQLKTFPEKLGPQPWRSRLSEGPPSRSGRALQGLLLALNVHGFCFYRAHRHAWQGDLIPGPHFCHSGQKTKLPHSFPASMLPS